jgi:uncharacterized protein YciI
LREQDGWGEHARIMERMVENGFILLGGPLEGNQVALLVIDATSEDAIHARLAEDNWTQNGMLETVSAERWTILLDGLAG